MVTRLKPAHLVDTVWVFCCWVVPRLKEHSPQTKRKCVCSMINLILNNDERLLRIRANNLTNAHNTHVE